MSCHGMSCLVLGGLVLPFLVGPCFVLSDLVWSGLVVSCLVLFCIGLCCLVKIRSGLACSGLCLVLTRLFALSYFFVSFVSFLTLCLLVSSFALPPQP
jgi:hypothetical protein